ncbi:methylamine utilization protein [Pseudomonas viridiflava]|uniref:methylamine utilization protein n=1 Tax=Pseudomonas viridiflava TaxID=33069 RepID=UPI000F04DBA2|nr:methylamine utilization protein [Pseudomonas viridiflava]
MSKLSSLIVSTCVLTLCTASASAATLTARVVDQQGKPLPDAVITLKGPAGKSAVVLNANMDQRDQEFVPRVLAVHSNTEVKFPNSDNIRHQVYSFSPAKRFELRLYSGTPSDPLLFDKPGVVVLGCNIHDWMVGYIYVTDEPWFAVSDANGVVKFEDMSAGHYSATLWHPKTIEMQPASGGDFDVPAAGLSKDFKLEVEPGDDDKSSAPAPDAFGDAFHKAAHQ